MGSNNKSISRKKLIKRIAKKAKISKKRAKIALKVVLSEGASFRKQKLKVIKLKKEVPVEVIKEVTVIREIDNTSEAKKKSKMSNKERDKKKPTDNSKQRIDKSAPVRIAKDAPKESKTIAQKKADTKKKEIEVSKPKAVGNPETKSVQKPERKAKAEKPERKSAQKPVRNPKEEKPKSISKEVEIEEKVEEFVVKPSPTKVKRRTVRSKADDLTKIEGIGPAISRLLKGGGITTFKGLAKAKVEDIRMILDKGGSRFKMHHPGTWPQQSALAADGKWEELNKLQETLKRGR